MISQQIAIYESLKAFMLAIGFANEAEQTEAVWSTVNQANYTSMMMNKFNSTPEQQQFVPTSLEQVHPDIVAHEAWNYREYLEADDSEVVYEAEAEDADEGDLVVDVPEGNPANSPSVAPAPEAPAATPAPTPAPTEAPAQPPVEQEQASESTNDKPADESSQEDNSESKE